MNKKEKQHPEYKKDMVGRRDFVKRIAGASLIGGTLGYVALAPENWPLSRKDRSGLRSVPKITPKNLRDYRVKDIETSHFSLGVGRKGGMREKLRRALDALGGISSFISPGDIVLVKPNVAFDRSPNMGATSNPEIMQHLIELILVEGKAQEVRVADNPIESPADCFLKSGVRLASEKAGGRIYLPDANAFKMLNTPGAKLIENWHFFYRPFTNVDKVIGVAPVKDHNLCDASMGIKNWYGLLGGNRNQFHQDIHEIVSDLSMMMKPTLTILDGTNILMENGPNGGDPSNVKKGDTVVAGIDPVALDAWAYENILERGVNYPQYIYKAEEKHSGKISNKSKIKELA